MPCLTFNLDQNGPLLELMVGVSQPRLEALKKAGEIAPEPVRVRGLIDTGASCTCIDPSVIQSLKLPPTGSVGISTPSTGSSQHTCNQYDVSIGLIHPDLVYTIHVLPVIESQLSKQGIYALIGRDVLSNCLLVYNGHINAYTLAF
ncbi:MAG: hypothetical protein HFP77_04015 [Methylococcales symbiont of Iophon sp. n. MRB-2018]|nr:MAG: hypothetical protein HFP77_04015 [Methylococcales symbiont of Iophon sp. n. MRB-2018]KAF3980132.1 MAG: hypothetical protein HFP76_03550 [Methylococcales symbiont of Iophon sp. n. MRB-2018]